MLESAVYKSVRKKLKKEFGKELWFFKTHGGADQIRGLPDLIGCYRGRFFAIELKKPGGHATDLQAFTLQQITDAGGFASVAHSVKEVLDFLSSVPEPPREAREDRD